MLIAKDAKDIFIFWGGFVEQFCEYILLRCRIFQSVKKLLTMIMVILNTINPINSKKSGWQLFHGFSIFRSEIFCEKSMKMHVTHGEPPVGI